MNMISFHSADRTLNIPNKTALKMFIEDIFKQEKKKLAALNYIFCSDEYLLELNRSHLDHDYYTDILTFDLSEKGGGITGEIYISLDRVRDNATQHSTTYKEEILRVILHGALHLCGYKDKTKAEQTVMRQMEDKYIRLFRVQSLRFKNTNNNS